MCSGSEHKKSNKQKKNLQIIIIFCLLLLSYTHLYTSEHTRVVRVVFKKQFHEG